MKAYKLTSRRLTVYLGEIRHIYMNSLNTGTNCIIRYESRDTGLQWVEKLHLSEEIRERHVIYLSGDLE